MERATETVLRRTLNRTDLCRGRANCGFGRVLDAVGPLGVAKSLSPEVKVHCLGIAAETGDTEYKVTCFKVDPEVPCGTVNILESPAK